MRINDRSKTDFDRAKIKLTGHFDRRPTGRYFEPCRDQPEVSLSTFGLDILTREGNKGITAAREMLALDTRLKLPLVVNFHRFRLLIYLTFK